MPSFRVSCKRLVPRRSDHGRTTSNALRVTMPFSVDNDDATGETHPDVSAASASGGTHQMSARRALPSSTAQWNVLQVNAYWIRWRIAPFRLSVTQFSVLLLLYLILVRMFFAGDIEGRNSAHYEY